MLVLTRRQGEKIILGDDVVLTIIRDGRNIRIGIEAPNHLRVVRAEIAGEGAVEQATQLARSGTAEHMAQQIKAGKYAYPLGREVEGG